MFSTSCVTVNMYSLVHRDDAPEDQPSPLFQVSFTGLAGVSGLCVSAVHSVSAVGTFTPARRPPSSHVRRNRGAGLPEGDNKVTLSLPGLT